MRRWVKAWVFSASGGRPWSELLKGISRRRMEELGDKEELSFLMLSGVLMRVMVQPFFCSSSWAKAKNGIMWPCAMNGNRTMCSLFCAIAVENRMKNKNG